MLRWILAVLALAVASAAAAEPRVQPLPASAASKPYVRAALPAGYVEQEYLVTVWRGDEGFDTLVNVRRPANRRRASGAVIVEPWHPGDLWPVQSTTQAYLARSGHTMVVAVSSPFVVERLLWRADPQRYGPPRAPFRPSVILLPDDAAFESEVLAQVGQLLKTGDVPGVRPRKLILAGYSNTGAVVRTYIAKRHNDGEHLYDGYLVGQTAVGTRPTPIRDIDAPVIEIQGESELIRTFARGGEGVGWRRPDGPNFRLYEVAGLSHLASRDEGAGDPIRWRCAHPERSQYPHRQTWSAILALLVRWVDKGVAAPHAPRIETADGGRTVLRDPWGNAKGGVRSPVLDAPVAAIMPVGEKAPGDPESARCDMVGWQRALAAEDLRRLYGDHAGYVAKFQASADALVRQGWLLRPDAAQLVAQARTTQVP